MPRLHPRYALVGCLFLAAFAIRCFHVTADPLWLDELYGYQLSQLGFGALLRNSMFEFHPPLFYVVQWLGSGFGTIRTEWAWRWTSVLFGTLTVVLVYAITRLTTRRFAALLVSAIMLVLPVAVYYSQDSRSYALLLLWSALATLMVVRIDQRPTDRRSWWLLALASVGGVWTGYSFVMVCAVQALYLAYRHGLRRQWMGYVAAMVAGCIPLAPLALSIFGDEQAKATVQEQLNIVELARMMLVGDTSRYGTHWGHVWIPLVYAGLIVVALAGFVRGAKPRGMLYHFLQIGIPLVAFFAVAIPLVGMRVPLFQWKQFVLLLPSLFAIVALGFQTLARRGRLGQTLAIALCGVILAGSAVTLRRMWSTTKSPEGNTVLALKSELEPGDAIVSLHYSINGALSFYLPDQQPYTYPVEKEGTLWFTRSTSVLRAAMLPAEHTATLADVRTHQRIWVLGAMSMPTDMLETITANCRKVSEQERWPFTIMLYDDCGGAAR